MARRSQKQDAAILFIVLILFFAVVVGLFRLLGYCNWFGKLNGTLAIGLAAGFLFSAPVGFFSKIENQQIVLITFGSCFALYASAFLYRKTSEESFNQGQS